VTLYLHYVGELDNWEVRCGFCVPRQVGKPQSGKLKQETLQYATIRVKDLSFTEVNRTNSIKIVLKKFIIITLLLLDSTGILEYLYPLFNFCKNL
jgi:hypothetical protein